MRATRWQLSLLAGFSGRLHRRGRRLQVFGLGCLLLATACSPLIPTFTPTPTPSHTPTPALSETASPTATLTATPAPSLTPSVSPTPSATLPPSAIPDPTISFAGDHWTLSEVVEPLGRPLAEPWLSFVNINDRVGIGDVRTPQPQTNVQTLYLINPRTGQRIALVDMPASTDDRVYWSPAGERVAYFLEGDGSADSTGLYVYDLTTGVSSRVIRLGGLSQRGFFSPPVWSPDGTRLALAASAGYDVDVYLMNADGTGLQNLTDHGAYDVWPAWSPDGRYLAFVSDRDTCASWRPGDGCLEANPGGPAGGMLYLADLTDGTVRRLGDEFLTEPPYWINPHWLGFTTGSLVLGDDFRRLWRVDVSRGQAESITLSNDPGLDFYLADSWSADGSRVVFQRAGAMTDIVLMDADGRELGSTDRFNFARFAVRATWSPDGDRLALGGRNGQCPHGLIVMTGDLALVSSANPPPTACDPVFSPNGLWIAYSGINPRLDGRLDLYVANANGFSAVNLSANLRGQIRILGWVGGIPAASTP